MSESITYREHEIKPKLDFGSGSGYLIDGKWVKEGFVVLKDGCNTMPGATWFQTVADARIAIDIWFEVGFNPQAFWTMWRERRKARLHNLNVLRVGTDSYHHQSGAAQLTPEFKAAIDAGNLADLILRQMWQGRCEIVTNYLPPYPKPADVPKLVVRIAIQGGDQNNNEIHYSYLRYSEGPRQGFFWDTYPDNLITVELAVVAISQAPYPVFTGPLVFKLSMPTRSVTGPERSER